MGRSDRAVQAISSVVTGVVVAHGAPYVVPFPGPAPHAHHIHAAIETYWHHVIALTMAAAAAAFVLAVARGVRRAGDPSDLRSPSLLCRMVHLTVWQVTLFAGMELAERAMAEVTPGAALVDPGLAVGLGVQVAVAALFVLVLGRVEDLAERFVRRLRASQDYERVHARWAPVTEAPGRQRTVRLTPRAPPAVAYV